MKRVIQFLFLLIFFFYIPFNGFLAQVITPPTQFPYGVYLSKGDSLNPVTYEYVDDLGMNTVIQYANGDNATLKDVLDKYNLVAIKNDSQNDAVAYYSGGYYTKWEAEDTTKNELETGIKADFGSFTNYSNTACWTSGTDLDNTNAIMLRGPQYRQDKKYLPWYMQQFDLKYKLRFNVAVSSLNGITPEPTDPVCKVSVIFTYINDQGITIDYPLEGADLTLYVSSFTGESFEPFEIVYSYPPEFEQYNSKMEGLNQYELLDYDDTYPGTGIQFKVTWFGNKQLYVDNFQVFDERIGDEIVNHASDVVSRVSSFANKYNGWDNIKYFFNVSEPQTIDRYTPMKIVDDILEAMNKPKGIAEFFPQWNGWRNGDRTIYKFKEMANPEKIMMEFITFVEGKQMEEMYEYQRYLLTELSDVNPVFWHESLIAEPTLPDGSKCWLYSPPPEKLNASIMLSLSFGAKGVFFWMLTSTDLKYEVNCNNNVWYKNILDENYLPNEPLYSYIKNDLSPRINGVLGLTLMNLSYSGNDLMLRDVTHPFIEDSYYTNIPYLSLTNNPVNNPINSTLNFFATDLDTTGHTQDNYFLLSNLITDGSRVAEMNVQSSGGVEGRYKNTRLRNIEPANNFDITFYDDTTLTYTFPAGEGYLFQVAPVVLYGGRLRYNETVGGGWTLNDDMIIENGATLTVTGIYNANANITVKDGGSIKTIDGGEIIFSTGKRLIIDGLASVKGTSSQNLTLDFNDQELTIEGSGIQVNLGSDFTLSDK